MSEYRRWYVAGGSYFLTPVTYWRRPLFATEVNVERLRTALATVIKEMPFEIAAAVIMPDHGHFIWSLPPGDKRYSKRVGRMKVEFTKQVRPAGHCASVSSPSRRRHRESDVWQRRFWEHTLDDIDDFKIHLDYIHFNPVKHGYVTCPHLWPHSSFMRWVERGVYESRGAASATAAGPNRSSADRWHTHDRQSDRGPAQARLNCGGNCRSISATQLEPSWPGIMTTNRNLTKSSPPRPRRMKLLAVGPIGPASAVLERRQRAA